ncbi:alpha/beta hydrolase [bacterium]|nr:alpha/beta hydrolase [bacterium]
MNGPAPSPVRGAIDVGAALLDDGVRTVAAVHAAIARTPFAALRRLPAIGGGAALVQAVHDPIVTGVYAAVAAGCQALGGAARLAGEALGGGGAPRAGSRADLAVAALNGFAGDRLADAGNPLAATMGLRHRGAPLAAQRAALAAAHPAASPRLVVFVHGLACNESLWRPALHCARGRAPRIDFGRRLARDVGCSALHVRYNTGLPIADNGRALSALLETVVGEWPVAIEELVLVGHSMGGLVLRSAAHQAAGAGWTARVRHVFYLGSPHRGAPLEKAANLAAWVLGRADVTRPFAALFNRRSRGIKDLRFGALRHEDWRTDADALLRDDTADLPLLEGAAHHFVIATVTRDRRHPLGRVVGDLLVRPASAGGRPTHAGLPRVRVHHVGAATHLDLLTHPAVYEQLRQALASARP